MHSVSAQPRGRRVRSLFEDTVSSSDPKPEGFEQAVLVLSDRFCWSSRLSVQTCLCMVVFELSDSNLASDLLPADCAPRGSRHVHLYEQLPKHRHRSLNAFEEHVQKHVSYCFFTQ